MSSGSEVLPLWKPRTNELRTPNRSQHLISSAAPTGRAVRPATIHARSHAAQNITVATAREADRAGVVPHVGHRGPRRSAASTVETADFAPGADEVARSTCSESAGAIAVPARTSAHVGDGIEGLILMTS